MKKEYLSKDWPPEEVGVGEVQEVGEQAWHQGEDLASQGGETLSPAAPCPHPYPAYPCSIHPLVCQGHNFAEKKQLFQFFDNNVQGLCSKLYWYIENLY